MAPSTPDVTRHGAPVVRSFEPENYHQIDRLLGVREVAEYLGVCRATVYRLCEERRLLHVRVSNAIRVDPADLAAFINLGGADRQATIASDQNLDLGN